MKEETCLYKENVASTLGAFELRVTSTGELVSIESSPSAVIIQSDGHSIIIKHVAAPNDWLPAGTNVDRAEAWLVYISKQPGRKETLTISFELPYMSATTQAGADTGQWLTAIEFEDGNRQVHIGTQDEEYFAWYGGREWMPKRLEVPLTKNELVVTSIEANGLKSNVPELLPQEQFYLHYILAESPRRKSESYPDEWDISTRDAVEQAREILEEAWNKQAKKTGNTFFDNLR